MKVVEIINEINKLSTVDKERLLSHFKYLLMPFHGTRPVFQEVSETKAKNGLCCVHSTASNVVRFGTFEVKNGLKTVKRQRYRCKNCQKNIYRINCYAYLSNKKIKSLVRIYRMYVKWIKPS